MLEGLHEGERREHRGADGEALLRESSEQCGTSVMVENGKHNQEASEDISFWQREKYA